MRWSFFNHYKFFQLIFPLPDVSRCSQIHAVSFCTNMSTAPAKVASRSLYQQEECRP